MPAVVPLTPAPHHRRGEWPIDLLDVPTLVEQGWRPTPFHEFVLKIHDRCNLACDYCYVYELADQSWRERVMAMPRPTIDQACRRIAEHAATHRLRQVRMVLHGGEPLLAGAETIGYTAGRLRAALPAGSTAEVSVQTNGVLLDEAYLAALRAAGVRVGVSLDGDGDGHDLHRRYADGRGSHADLARALRLLRAEPDLYAGLLCVVDLANDPVRVYEALLEHSPPAVDFLLPHGNWTEPPPGRPADGTAPYGDWLVTIFDRWYGAPTRETGVRLFEEIMNLLLGGQSRCEAVGTSPYAVAVIETDGTLEQVDTLRSAYHGAAATGLNIFDHPLDEALHHPGVAARQLGSAGLSQTCARCPVGDVCGGGSYPHRYRAGHGFRNPSVYCADLLRLITHISARLRTDLSRLSGQQVPGRRDNPASGRPGPATTTLRNPC